MRHLLLLHSSFYYFFLFSWSGNLSRFIPRAHHDVARTSPRPAGVLPKQSHLAGKDVHRKPSWCRYYEGTTVYDVPDGAASVHARLQILGLHDVRTEESAPPPRFRGPVSSQNILQGVLSRFPGFPPFAAPLPRQIAGGRGACFGFSFFFGRFSAFSALRLLVSFRSPRFRGCVRGTFFPCRHPFRYDTTATSD